MLRTIALLIAVGVIGGGTALAQTIHRPLPADPGGTILVKHDKDDDNGDNGRGRKLGHHKHDRDDDLGDNGTSTTTTRRTDRFGNTVTTTTTTRRSSNNPSPYYGAPPYYGGSYGAPYYYGPPYYRGY